MTLVELSDADREAVAKVLTEKVLYRLGGFAAAPIASPTGTEVPAP